MASNHRPNHIDLAHSTFDPQRLGSPSPGGDVPSPRSGDVPPALSPLDAFALQSRLLAAKFEEQDGRRISRLPPLTVANEFAKPRPSYFTRPAAEHEEGDANDSTNKPEPSGSSPEVSKSSNKHRSFYPSILSEDSPSSLNNLGFAEKPALEPVTEERSPDLNGQQTAWRAASPEPLAGDSVSMQMNESSRVDFAPEPPKKTPTNESLRSNWSASSALAPPPRSPLYPSPRSPLTQPSIRSVRMDSGDDSDALSFQSDPYDLTTYQRKPSLKSFKDRPRSPFSPTFSGRRSPSISSEISNGELQQPPRRSMNFSRPLSPANRVRRPSIDSRPSYDQSTRMLTVDNSPPIRPSMDTNSIQDSLQDSTQDSLENLETPTRPYTEEAADNLTDDEQKPVTPKPTDNAQSFVYRTYTLPRGRKVTSRGSKGSFKAESWLAHQFEWDHPSISNPNENAGTTDGQEAEQNLGLERQPTLPTVEDAPSPPKATAHKHQASYTDFQNLVPPEIPADVAQSTRNRSKSYDDGFARTAGASRFVEEGLVDPLPQPMPKAPVPSLPKSSTGSPSRGREARAETPTLHSVRKKSQDKSRKSEEKERRSLDKKRSKKNIRDAATTPTPPPDHSSAEEHLAIGIEAHDNGQVQKSTYHLRLAARAGLPSAMVLYALACRHGWGMRPNLQEAVLWLRKAIDLSKIEVDATDLLPPGYGGPQDKLAAKQHKSQLALSIYELGVSYFQGWGIQKDQGRALKCFEIASSWGDADALSEAGFCYAKGAGCKKDLMKAAAYYRRAEQMGVSMAGNSWIHKEKYDPKEPANGESDRGRGKDDDKKKKTRDKSRTRTFFGGRKKHQDMAV